jgi:carbonic anhydrase
MSCSTATAPINISISKITGNCDMKCAYSFFYNNSACIVTNKGGYLSISYDKSSAPPVVYNAAAYDVNEIRIYTPSLHSYSDSKTAGEMIIIHKSNTGANDLLVCIPIKLNNSTSGSALFMQTLINTVSSNAPSEGGQTSVNIPRFNLNTLVPHKPFFSYTATLPYQPCFSTVDYVVFDPTNAYLDIMDDSLNKLYRVISQNPYDIKSGPNLFYNQKGPGSGGALGNEIYIDCQPVGESEEMSQIVTDGSGYTTTADDFLSNPYVKIVLASLLFIILLYGVKSLLGIFKPAKGGGLSGTNLNGGSFQGIKK